MADAGALARDLETLLGGWYPEATVLPPQRMHGATWEIGTTGAYELLLRKADGAYYVLVVPAALAAA